MFRIRTVLGALGAILVLLLLAACSSTASQTTTISTPTATASTAASSTPDTSTPTPVATLQTGSTTASPTSTSGASAINTVLDFYAAVKAQNYEKAYTYMAPGATMTINGVAQKLTKESFLQLTKTLDTTVGKLTDYTALADSTNAALIIMTAARENLAQYHSHFQLQQTGSGWQITTFDTI